MKLVSWSAACLIFVAAFTFAIPSKVVRYLIPVIGAALPKQEYPSTSPIDDLAPQANQFFAGDNSQFDSNKWSTSAGGPFTGTFVSGNVMNFAKVNGTADGSGNQSIGGMNATENLTLVNPGGTISTGGTVVPITVAAGKTLNLGSQVFATAAGTGFIKNGGGVFATSNSGQFPGGFTMNDGTIVIGNSASLGGGATNFLNINGGVIAASAPLTLTNRFPMGIRVGGDFQLGAQGSVVPSVPNAPLTFNNGVDLGPASRTITIGSNAQFTFAGAISGSPQVGLTIVNAPGASGIVSLQGVNTYTGNTTIRGGLSVTGSGSIANSPVIEVTGTGVFDVKALTTPLTLANSQTLRASGTSTSGLIGLNSTKGLTTAANTRIEFTAFTGLVAPLAITGAGTLSLQSGNVVAITIANGGTALGIGDYKLISKGPTGTVTGLPTSVTVDGDGIVGTPSLVLIAGELYLRVTPDTIPPAAPTITASDPASPAASLTPNILGTAETNSLVRVYRSGDCSGSPVATQQLSSGASSFSVGVSVNASMTTLFSATATDASNNTSGCSNPFAYQHAPSEPDIAPPTITYSPLMNLEMPADQTLTVIVIDDSALAAVTVQFEVNGGSTATSTCSQTGEASTYSCVIPAALQPVMGAVSYYVTAVDTADNGSTNPEGGSPSPGIPGPRNLFTVGSGGSIDTSLIGVFENVRVGSDFTFTDNARISNELSITGNIYVGSNILTLGCIAHISGAGQNAYVIGFLEKEFCGPEIFTFPVGTIPDAALVAKRNPEGPAPEYSPFTADVASVSGVSSLKVLASDGVMDGVYPGQSVRRWWDVAESGDITATINYQWLDQDLSGDEPAFKVIRRTAFSEVYSDGTVDASSNSAKANGVTEFGGWSAGFLSPTAASVGMSGVITGGGRGLPNAIVKLTRSNGEVAATARTSAFGYYTIEGLTSGESYILTITAKRFTFPPRVITLPSTQEGRLFRRTLIVRGPSFVPRQIAKLQVRRKAAWESSIPVPPLTFLTDLSAVI